MSGLPITIDDTSPLIDYQPPAAWVQQNSDTDVIGHKYYSNTFTQTQQLGATASFSFNGTSITIYGGKRDNYGNFTINVDGTTEAVSGFAATPGLYQTPIFASTALRQGLHVVTIMNTQYTLLDIDFITWTSDISTFKSGPVNQSVTDDAEEAFQYDPPNAWTNAPSNLSLFNGGTGHMTSQVGASVNYTFTGTIHRDAISLFGTVGPQNGPYRVQIDDWPVKTYEGNKVTYKPQTLLFYASNLGHGNHSILVTNQGVGRLEVDYALVNTASRTIHSSTPVPGPTGFVLGDGTTPRLPISGIVGITIGVVTIVALSISLWVNTNFSNVNPRAPPDLRNKNIISPQFDSQSPSSPNNDIEECGLGFHIASDTKPPREFLLHVQSPSTEMREASTVRPLPEIRPPSILSNVSSSASTLVAEDGSNTARSRGLRRLGFKKQRQRIGNSNLRINRLPPPVLPHPPQLPSLIPIGRLMPIESVPELMEPPPTALTDTEDSIEIPVLSPTSSSLSLKSDRLDIPSHRNAYANAPPLPSRRSSPPVTYVTSPDPDPETASLLGLTSSAPAGGQELGKEILARGPLPRLVVSTFPLTRGRMSPSGAREMGTRDTVDEDGLSPQALSPALGSGSDSRSSLSLGSHPSTRTSASKLFRSRQPIPFTFS